MNEIDELKKSIDDFRSKLFSLAAHDKNRATQACILAIMDSRGAASEETMILEEELMRLTDWAQGVMGEVRLLSSVFVGDVAAFHKDAAGELTFAITAEGRRKLEKK